MNPDVYGLVARFLNRTPYAIHEACKLMRRQYPAMQSDDIALEVYSRIVEEIHGGVPGRDLFMRRFASVLGPAQAGIE